MIKKIFLWFLLIYLLVHFVLSVWIRLEPGHKGIIVNHRKNIVTVLSLCSRRIYFPPIRKMEDVHPDERMEEVILREMDRFCGYLGAALAEEKFLSKAAKSYAAITYSKKFCLQIPM